MWAYGPKIGKNGNFWYKFAPKGYIPLSNFYKSLLGEGAQGPHPHATFHRRSFKKCGLMAQNRQKW